MTSGLVNPTLTFRNAGGTGRQTSWEVGDMFEPNTNTIGFFASGNATGTMDLTGAKWTCWWTESRSDAARFK